MAEGPVRHPIHTRLVMHADGEADQAHAVFCRHLDRSVPLGVCEGCPRLTKPVDAHARDAAVECNVELRPVAKTADARERATRAMVGELMQRRVTCVDADVGIDSLERMVEEGETIVVTNNKGRPLGMVSRLDVLRARRDGGADTAEEVMTPLVHAIVEDAPVSFVVAMLALEDVSQVPVVTHEGKVTGAVRARDLVRWLARELGYEVLSPGD